MAALFLARRQLAVGDPPAAVRPLTAARHRAITGLRAALDIAHPDTVLTVRERELLVLLPTR